MSIDDAMLPPAVSRGHELFVGSEHEPYVRDLDETLFLQITDLSIHGGFELEDIHDVDSSKIPVRESLNGHVELEHSNYFAVAGLDLDRAVPIVFQLREVNDDDAQYVWRATIGFTASGSQKARSPQFLISAYVPHDALASILYAVRDGHVRALRVGMRTTMWIQSTSRSAKGMSGTIWNLVPPPDRLRSRSPAFEWADIDSLTWAEIFSPEMTPLNPPDRAATIPTVIERPPRRYEIWGGIFGTILFAGGLFLLRK